jgi:hypothetical protein
MCGKQGFGKTKMLPHLGAGLSFINQALFSYIPYKEKVYLRDTSHKRHGKEA